MKVYDIYLSVKNTEKWNESTEKLMKKFDEVLKMLKHAHPEKYKKIKDEIYIEINGYHFNEEFLKDAFSKMENDNGTPVPKWSVDETTKIANNLNMQFTTFNEYDLNYVLNMLYSDYAEVFGENVSYYFKIAEKFLNDKDAVTGKAFKYYLATKKD